jgi:hypothetical protein
MGGKSAPSNSQMVQFQMQQAQEARDRETLRQNRLNAGKAAIDQLFGPTNFGDPFFNRYRDASLDYNLPQLETQYNRARDNLTYDLARAGTLRSSAAGQAQGILEGERGVNEAGLRARADTDTATLRQSIASQQQQALNQLFSTEDPDVAANTATHMVANAQLAQPQQTPLGDLFRPLVIGAGAAFQGYQDQNTFRNAMNTRSPYDRGSFSVTPT